MKVSASAITFDDLASAMNALRQEIPGLIAPSISGLRSEIDTAVGAALVEIRQQSATTAQHVTSAVDEQFQSAATGLTNEQDRLNNILHAEHHRLSALLDQLTIDVRTSVEKVFAVTDGKLDEVATALLEQRATMEAYKPSLVCLVVARAVSSVACYARVLP